MADTSAVTTTNRNGYNFTVGGSKSLTQEGIMLITDEYVGRITDVEEMVLSRRPLPVKKVVENPEPIGTTHPWKFGDETPIDPNTQHTHLL